MLFSEAELLCFNSVLDGKRIFGTFFQAPEVVSKEYIDNAVMQLIDHKFLDEKKKPNESFHLAVKVLKEYKDAKRYLIINQMRIAFAKDNVNIICLFQKENGYEITVMRKEFFLYDYMKKTPFLAAADTKERISGKMQINNWLKELEPPSLENYTFIQEIKEHKLGGMYILYQKESQGYLYEPINEVIKRGGSLQFRHLLMNLFEMNVEELYHGQQN